MRLSCPNCSTEYEVPDAALAGRSRKLKCELCAHQWRSPEPQATPTAVAVPAPEWSPAAPAAAWTAEPLDSLAAEPRRFGEPVDEAAQAEIIAATQEEEKFSAPAAAGMPAAIDADMPASMAEMPAQAAAAELNTAEGLPLFLIPSYGQEAAPAAAKDAAEADPDRFADLVYAARNKTVEYEADAAPAGKSKVSSNKPLFVILVLALVIALVFLEHREIIHMVPASAGFFQGLGLK